MSTPYLRALHKGLERITAPCTRFCQILLCGHGDCNCRELLTIQSFSSPQERLHGNESAFCPNFRRNSQERLLVGRHLGEVLTTRGHLACRVRKSETLRCYFRRYIRTTLPRQRVNFAIVRTLTSTTCSLRFTMRKEEHVLVVRVCTLRFYFGNGTGHYLNTGSHQNFCHNKKCLIMKPYTGSLSNRAVSIIVF